MSSQPYNELCAHCGEPILYTADGWRHDFGGQFCWPSKVVIQSKAESQYTGRFAPQNKENHETV